MKEIFRYGLILFAVCVIAAGALSLVYRKTKPIIEKSSLEEANSSAREVLPAADSFVVKDGIKFGYNKQGECVGKVIETVADGYGGAIKLIIGVDPEGKVTGVKILSHSETPGLGAKIQEPWFTRQFIGKTKADLGLKPEGEIDAITAATISSRAVTDAVQKVVTGEWLNLTI